MSNKVYQMLSQEKRISYSKTMLFKTTKKLLFLLIFGWAIAFFVNYLNNTQDHKTLEPTSVVHMPKAFIWFATHSYHSDSFIYCSNCTRPRDNAILMCNNLWQYFIVDNNTKHFVLGAYFDDREFNYGPNIKIFPVIKFPSNTSLRIFNYSALLWYENIIGPISSKCVFVSSSPKLPTAWNFGGFTYANARIKCPVPKVGNVLPTHISLVELHCKKYPTTYLPLIFPQNNPKGPTSISACVKCLYGEFGRDKAPYLVSWMESLKIFGMHEIFMDEDISYMDPIVFRIFKYYKETGFLNMRKVSNNLFDTIVPVGTDLYSQTVVFAITNDCFYRNLHKYNYLLHIDLDEIVVPRKHATYTEIINHYMQQNPRLENATSLLSMSAHFYTYFNPGTPQAPAYVPILQYSYRTPVIIPRSTNDAGVRKAFQNTKTCSGIHIHSCGKHLQEYRNISRLWFSPEDMLVHHYRSSCKLGMDCPDKNYTNINDPIMWVKFGTRLQSNVEYVLSKVGYFA